MGLEVEEVVVSAAKDVGMGAMVDLEEAEKEMEMGLGDWTGKEDDDEDNDLGDVNFNLEGARNWGFL